MDTWGNIADIYLKNNYDFFILDYRGFGKSDGKITSEQQLYNDIQIVYDSIKKLYKEEKIVIAGYSIGTGIAAQLASANHPQQLILLAPYYNFPDLAKHHYRFIPEFSIRYKLATNEYIQKTKCPISIFHGNKDEVIPYTASLKLKTHFKNGDQLFILENQSHYQLNENTEFQRELKRLLIN